MIFYKIFILLTFANLGFALNDKKSNYQDVLIEIEEVLDNYHFKKNLEINLIEVYLGFFRF